ncbi:hypothetical protein BDQ17DRAFT_1441479 [Cyathus striatus]|nr:hypothetical protein BDQ17DRAFT_1441479 [Cyathus striatus]
MLADECPNLDCYGVPLVRRPKAGGEKDPRKECVICESIYLTEVDWAGREQLIPESLQIPRAIPENTTSAVRSHTISEPSATVLPKTALAIESLAVEQTETKVTATSASTKLVASPLGALDESVNALRACVHALSTKLNVLSSLGALDTTAIANTADAISKVTQALTHVRQLQWSETHASTIQ